MRGKVSVVAGMVFAGVMCAQMAGSEGMNSIGGKFGLFGNLGFSTYAMGDVNSDIKAMNDVLDARASTGYTVEKGVLLNGGMTLNGGLHYGITNNLLVGIEAGYLMAGPVKYSYKGSITTTTAEPIPYPPYVQTTTLTVNDNGAYEYTLPATEIGLVFKGFAPVGENLLLGGGLGLDYISLSGKSKYTYNDTTTEDTFTGTTVGVKIMGSGELFLTSNVSLGLDLGYRMAKISEVKDKDGNVAKYSNGSNWTVDYSGLIAQGGIRLYF
jgi:hypothetical protein